jgi:hypothetical protein
MGKKISAEAVSTPEAPETRKTKKTTAAQNGSGKESKRLRLFKLLNEVEADRKRRGLSPRGLNNGKIRASLKTESVAALCRDEAVAGRLKVLRHEDGRGMFFCLSAAGRKALEKGTVDSEAAPKGEWPE